MDLAHTTMPISPRSPPTKEAPRYLRWLWLSAAYVSLALGIIGIALPGLPTVPFILLASYCAARGSRRLHLWLREHSRFGPMIRDWENGGAVSRRAKWFATITMVICSGLMWLSPAPFVAWISGTSIMMIVGTWLWFRPEPPIQ